MSSPLLRRAAAFALIASALCAPALVQHASASGEPTETSAPSVPDSEPTETTTTTVETTTTEAATTTTAAVETTTSTTSTTVAPVSDAAAYCTEQGGTVETRYPYVDTNLDQADWTQLAGSLDLCWFQADDEAKSRIYVDLETLWSEHPSLAGAAYLAKLPLAANSTGANPAAVNCAQQLGGAVNWGTTVNGGGWVNLDEPEFTVVDLCVFSDQSAIDQWGIAYYSDGTVRGADLAPMFRFDPSAAAAIFPPAPPTSEAPATTG